MKTAWDLATFEMHWIYMHSVAMYCRLASFELQHEYDLGGLCNVIEDCFCAVAFNGVYFGTDSHETRSHEDYTYSEKWWNEARDYFNAHPEWYLTDWLSQSPLYQAEVA